MLIDTGTIIYDGPIERIKEQYGTHRTLSITLTEPRAHVELPDTELISNEGTIARFRFDRNKVRADELIRAATDRYEITDVSIEEPELESIIRRIYVEGYNDPALKTPREVSP